MNAYTTKVESCVQQARMHHHHYLSFKLSGEKTKAKKSKKASKDWMQSARFEKASSVTVRRHGYYDEEVNAYIRG